MSFFATATTAVSFMTMFVLGIFIPALGVLCYTRFAAGCVLVVGIFAIEALYMQLGGLRLGIAVYYTDFVLVFVAAVTLFRLLAAPDFPRRHPAWLVFCVVVMISLGSGLLAHGSTAGVQARPYFYFITAGLYALAFPMDEKRVRFALGCVSALALLLMVLSVYRWVVYYTPITSLLPEEGNYNADGAIRVIRSFETLVLAQVLVVGLFFAGASRWLGVARAVSPGLLAAVVTLQHRSVWLAVLVGLMCAFWVGRLRRGSWAGQAFLLTGIVVVTALPMALSDKLSAVSQQVGSSAARAVAGSDTTGERLSSWRAMIGNWAGAGPRALVIGQSFGTSNERYVEDQGRGGLRKITYGAHNFYVQTLYNTGIVGLGAFVAAAAYTLAGLYRLCRSGVGGAPAQALLVMLVMQLAYYVPYGTDYLQCLLFGMGMAFVASHDHRTVTGKGVGAPASMWRRWSWA